MYDYIDVRGTWPVYINGFIAHVLEGFNRNVTVEEAREYIYNKVILGN